jgi:hypothetical protein
MSTVRLYQRIDKRPSGDVMRIGSALDALDYLSTEMQALNRREKLATYTAIQTITDRLRSIAKSKGLSVGLINAQLMKITFSAEALAGLGGGKYGQERHFEDIRAALGALTGPDCLGYLLDEVE